MTTTTQVVGAREGAPGGAESGAGAGLPADEPPSSTGGDVSDEPGQRARAVVDVRDDAGFGAGRVSWCDEKLCAALGVLGATGEVRIVIVDDQAMSAEHGRALGVEGTTDVITFDLTDGAGAGDRVLDVDLLVCADEACRRAVERGIPVERELLLYMLHGVLHCLGYDDTDEDAYRAMHAREDGVLEAIGVGATFGGLGEDAS